jgi:hypothetical protein
LSWPLTNYEQPNNNAIACEQVSPKKSFNETLNPKP